MGQKVSQRKRKKNLLLNVLINLAIPIIILTKFSGAEHLGAHLGLIVALSFPLTYGLWELRTEQKINVFSALGVVSVLLTGTIGLFELPNTWLAYKEASIPFLVGVILIASHKIGHSLFTGLIGEALDLAKVFEAARKKKKRQAIERGISISNYVLAGVFFAAAIANFILAKLIVVSVPGTEAYNAELGVLTGLSFIVIFVPFLVAFILIVIFLMLYMKQKTGLTLEEIMI